MPSAKLIAPRADIAGIDSVSRAYRREGTDTAVLNADFDVKGEAAFNGKFVVVIPISIHRGGQ